jgi:holdfast attachment protein HfaA
MNSRKLAFVIGTALAVMAPAFAQAQSVSTTGEWERPYGVALGQENRAWAGATSAASAASRSADGNRVIVDGLIQTGVGVSSQVNGIFGGGVGNGIGSNATAIGNQLNVNVTGRWNTVVVNSTQVNNGDINANAQATGNTSEETDD